MNIYIHEGPGHYVGSAIVVLAGSLEEAEKYICDYLYDNGLREEQLNIRATPLQPGIIYAQNGDY